MLAAIGGIFAYLKWTIGVPLLIILLGIGIYLIWSSYRGNGDALDTNSKDILHKRIELANQYLPKIEETLKSIRIKMASVVDKAAQKEVTYSQLEAITKELTPLISLITSDNETDNLKYHYYLNEIMDKNGIGLDTKYDSDILNLENELKTYSNPDSKLGRDILRYKIILKGVYSQKLFNIYLAKTTNKQYIESEAMEPHIDKAMQKVSKRIYELLCGEEPK